MTPDPLALLRRADPGPAPSPYDPRRARALLDRVTSGAVHDGGDTPTADVAPPALARRRRRPPRAAGAALGVALLVGGGGVAYAVFHQPASTALGLACAAGASQQEFEQAGYLFSVMDISSGDPVADCAAEYTRRGVPAPELRGYTNGTGLISVVPADWPVPDTWQPLAGTFRNDPARLELKQRLGDLIDGPEAQCRSTDQVQGLVEQDLADLGLTGWTIDRLEQAGRADGHSWCALAFLDDAGSPTVSIQGLPGPANGQINADEPFGELLHSLRRDITGQCLPLPIARQLVEQAVTAAGFDPLQDAKITTVEDPAGACTRADMPASGLIEITLRGPSG